MSIPVITPLTSSPDMIERLSAILIAVVTAGGSVGFMHPLEKDDAWQFWNAPLAAAARGERVVLGAWDGAALAGTVTLLLDCPPNQPHRAEIGKMMIDPRHRGKGLAVAALQEAERLAVDHGRTLLVLDTATEEGAAGLYEKCGFTLAGTIPDYALKPHGGLTGTHFYWKRIGPPLT
jgi:ribosomal protein S18 acetylase RimI-like enzyme